MSDQTTVRTLSRLLVLLDNQMGIIESRVVDGIMTPDIVNATDAESNLPGPGREISAKPTYLYDPS